MVPVALHAVKGETHGIWMCRLSVFGWLRIVFSCFYFLPVLSILPVGFYISTCRFPFFLLQLSEIFSVDSAPETIALQNFFHGLRRLCPWRNTSS